MGWFDWFWNKEELTPGKCECGHNRCSHSRGRYKCHVSVEQSICACQLYIRKEDGGDDDDSPPTPIDPDVSELNRMLKL